MNWHGKNVIGERPGPGAAETFCAVNPLDNSTLPPAFHTASIEDVNAVMELAETAFARFRDTTGEERAAFLESIADAIMALQHFIRPICRQDFPAPLLPEPFRNENPPGLWRTLNGTLTKTGVDVGFLN